MAKSWYKELAVHAPAIDGPMSVLFTNPLSIVLLQLIRNFSVNPTFITVIAFFCGVGSIALILQGDLFSLAVAAALIQFSFILDGLDGTYARYKKLTSYSGAWIDRVLDRIIDIGLTAAIGSALNAQSALTVAAIISLVLYWRSHDATVVASKLSPRPTGSFTRCESYWAARGLRFTFGRDLFLWTISLGCLFRAAEPALEAIVIVANINWTWRYFSTRHQAPSQSEA